MRLQAFETGIQRFYYVAWAMFSLFMCIAGASMVQHEMRDRLIRDWDILAALAYVLAVCVGPWIAMRLFRWVYRGFVPLK